MLLGNYWFFVVFSKAHNVITIIIHNPAALPTLYFVDLFYIFLPSTHGPPTWSFRLRFAHHNSMYNSYFLSLNCINLRVVKFLIIQHSPLHSHYNPSLRYKYLPQRFVLKHLQSMCFL
jgi:hypothetical protein